MTVDRIQKEKEVGGAINRFFIIFFLIIQCIAANAQYDENLSPRQQLSFYKSQADSAQIENDALRMAQLYGEMVRLCKEHPVLENELAENLFYYGMWSTYAGNNQTAIETLIELLDMPDMTDDKSLLTLKARANNTLGTIYFFKQQWDNALSHYQKSRDMAIELQNNLGISIAENNIGNIYQKKENHQAAIEHYLRCLELQENIDNKETICNTYYNLGTCYNETGDFSRSLLYLNQALDLSKEIGDKEMEALSLVGLASYYGVNNRQFDEALKHIINAEKISKESGYNQVLTEVFKTRSAIDEKHGNITSALDYYKQYKSISDTLFNESSMTQLHEYEVRYKTQEKELRILQQQSEIERQKTGLYLSVGGLIASFLLLAMLVYTVMLHIRRNRQLSETNAIKDKFFSIISHDLKNPVNAQREAMQTLAAFSRKMDPDTLSECLSKILKSQDGLAELLKNLLAWATIQTGRNMYSPVSFNLVTALQSDIEVVKGMAEHKEITLETLFPSSAIVTADINMFVTIVRNLLTNAVKFTKSGGKVSLQIKEIKNGMYSVKVSDTGVGMTSEQVQNLFRIDRQHLREGTAGEQSSGIGLIVCRDMLRRHGRELFVESEEGKGSVFWFEV